MTSSQSLEICRWAILAVVLATLSSVADQPRARGAQLRTVALTTIAVVDPNHEFWGVSAPVINDVGQTAFQAELPGPDEHTGGYSIWSEGGGALSMVARTGATAEGDGDVFSYVTDPQIGSAGEVIFQARLSQIPGTDLYRE